jgi:hypothetical protein
MKILPWLLGVPIVLIIFGVTGTELNKAYWDSRVSKMCAEEGGISIYESVRFSEEEFIRYGGDDGVITVPDERSARSADFPFAISRNEIQINESFPRVIKRETSVYRKQDNKLLGAYIRFSRIGGDFPTGLAADSSFSCQDINGFRTDLEKQIFLVEGE